MKKLELTESTKRLLEDNIDEQFEAFLDNYKKNKYNIYKSDFDKYENGKLYYKSSNGWHLQPDVKIMRNLGRFKIGSVHFECALPYSNYYIIDTDNGNVYRIDDIVFYGSYNGMLKQLINDLNLVNSEQYIDSIKPKKFDFDVTASI